MSLGRLRRNTLRGVGYENQRRIDMTRLEKFLEDNLTQMRYCIGEMKKAYINHNHNEIKRQREIIDMLDGRVDRTREAFHTLYYQDILTDRTFATNLNKIHDYENKAEVIKKQGNEIISWIE